MKVSDYVLMRLADVGVTHIFGVYGGAVSELFDAFTRQSRIQYIVPIHEQCASFMAEGYAQTKGVTGVALGTSGPGGQNMVTGIANCFYNSVPAIFITGQVQVRFMRPNTEMRQLGFQESPQVDIVRPITKWAHCVKEPESIRMVMDRALMECRSGRPGPVLLDIPIDVQKMEVHPDEMGGRGGEALPDSPIKEVFLFRRDLEVAKRPAILVGGGAYQARHAIRRFAEAYRIPVFRTWNALDIITDDSRIYGGTVGTYGGPGRNFGIQNCDLLLSLGCRFSGRITGGLPKTFARGAKKYIVDIDPVGLKYQEVKGDVNVLADAIDFARLLSLELSMPPAQQFIDWLAQVRGWLTKYDPVKPEHYQYELHHYAFIRRLSELLPWNAIVVSDTGGNVIMMGHAFRSKQGQRIFSSNGNTPMGFAMCGAMGAWFAEPTRPVICIIGDGGFQMNLQELQTMKHYGINIKVFIINNACLGNTKSYQRVNKMAEVACGPDGYSVPDFQNVTMAYGLAAFSIPKRHYIDTIVNQMLETNEPCVCNVEHLDFCQYEPRISEWDVGIEDAFPFLPRDEFRKNMIVEPLPGWESKR